MSEEVLNKFLDHIQSYIENTPDLSLLIKKRFKECSESYIQSSKFEDILQTTRAKIDSDSSRVFVYLRDFLNELKSNKAERKLKKKRKLLDTGFDSSEAPSPKSVCSNDTDCSVVEIDEVFSQAQQQHNKVNKLSLKHCKQNCKNVDKSESSQGVLNGHCEGELTVKAQKSNREESQESLDTTNQGESNSTESDKLKTPETNKEENTGHKLLGTTCVNGLVQISDGGKSVEDLVLPDITDNIDKSKGSSDSNAKNDEIECITIDDDDDEEGEGDSVEVISAESTKETKTKESPVLFGSSVVSEHSNNTDTKQSSSLKEAKEQICSGNTEKICDELKTECVEVTSDSKGEEVVKKPKRVEIKTLELHQTGNGNKQATDGVQEGSTSEAACTDSQEEIVTTVTDSTESSEPVKKGSQRQIRRLENLLEDIRNKIELLKNADLSLDALGEEDSAYIQEDRYQQKFVKVWRKLCELKGAESSTGRPIERRFYYKGTRYPEVNRNLERFINKHKIFPDFHDVQKVIRDTSKKKKLALSGPAIDRLAREAFQDIGDLLQKRRISDLRKTSLGHLPEEQGVREDPALKDPDLKKKLDQNRKVAKGKLDDVLEKFCKWQEEAPPVDENEDKNKKSEDEEEEEEEEEEENQEEMDVPELTAILNDSEEEASASPIKTSTSPRKTTDGSSSSVCDGSDTALRHSPGLTDRKAASPHSSSGSHKVSNDKISLDSSPNPRSPYVANSPDPTSPDVANSPDPTSPDVANLPDPMSLDVANLPELSSPYVVNSPDPTSPDVANLPELSSPYVANSPDPTSPDVANLPDPMSLDVANPLDSTSPDVANSPQDLPMANDVSAKPKTSLLSIEDYMDHMPVLKTSHSDYDLQISDIRSIFEDSTENQQGSSLPNSLKEGAKRQLKWPAANGTGRGSGDIDREKSLHLHSDRECKSSPCSNKKQESHSTNDRNDGGEVSSAVSNLSSTQHSIMFRNSRKLLSLKPLYRKTTVIDLAGEEEKEDVVSIPNRRLTGSSNTQDDDVIVLSDSD